MVVACWSVKGGVGASVVSAAAAAVLARREGSALLVDLAGDLPSILGVPEPDGPGACDWLHAEAAVGPEALPRLEREVGPGLGFVHRGRRGPGSPERASALVTALAGDDRAAVVDVGRVGSEDADGDAARRVIVEGATISVLVTRACYLGLRRALASPLRPDGIVLVSEPGRAISRSDVVDVLGVPVVAEVAVDPAVARAVDAGLLTSRLPADLARALADVA